MLVNMKVIKHVKPSMLTLLIEHLGSEELNASSLKTAGTRCPLIMIQLMLLRRATSQNAELSKEVAGVAAEELINSGLKVRKLDTGGQLICKIQAMY